MTLTIEQIGEIKEKIREAIENRLQNVGPSNREILSLIESHEELRNYIELLEKLKELFRVGCKVKEKQLVEAREEIEKWKRTAEGLGHGRH